MGSIGLSPPRAGDVPTQVWCPPPCAPHHFFVSPRSPGSWHQRAGPWPGHGEEGTGTIWVQDGRGGFAATTHWALGLPYFIFFAATGLAKLGYPRDVPLGMVGLALAPPVRTQRGGPLRGGDPARDGCSWGAAGTCTSPRPDPLADALRSPALPAGGDCPATVGLFQHCLQ